MAGPHVKFSGVAALELPGSFVYDGGMKILALAFALGSAVCVAEIEVTESRPASPPVTPGPTTIAVGADADVVKFRNGDVLHGTVAEATATGVRWRRSDVKEPIRFGAESVNELVLAPRVKPAGGRLAVVELTNGDSLTGELVGLDEKVLTLKSWYAGTLAIRRAMAQRVLFGGESMDTVYSGPTSLDEWKSDGNRGAWSYKKGALYGAGSGMIGRDVKLPEVASVEFDVAWRGQVAFGFGFGFDDVRQIYNSGGYLVQVNYSTVYMQRYRQNSGSNNMGSNAEMQELQRKSRLRVALKINKPKKTIAVFFDGNLVKQWAEGDDWVARGTGFVLSSQGQGQMRISNITVSGWDGRLEGEAAATAKEADIVRLSNGDKVSGKVKSMTVGQVQLAASFAEMNVPLERVVGVEFASDGAERARRKATDIAAFFPDGRRWTFGLEKLDEQVVTGECEACGRLTAKLGAFSRVQFHIYEKREDDNDGDGWTAATMGDD